jgi:serine/threonine-protein kinase
MIGVRLGPWIVDEEIGRGGMGAVYKAHRAPDAGEGPMLAAIKVLAAELAVEVGFQQRFQREIDILRKVDHPNIVRFYDSGKQDGRYFYAMEYIAGPSFEAMRDSRGRVPWLEVLDLAWQISPALKHAHDRGIIHRDLKPSNILRAADPAHPEVPPVVKLTDFGIASLFASPHLTVTGGVIGTPEYLSPEQAAGKPVTRRSDLYSLGVVLYTLVTGTTPFTGEPLDLMHKHRFAQFDRPGRIVSDLPPDFDEVICNLLEKDPSRRPGDAMVLFRQLDSLRRKLARQAAARGGETLMPSGVTPPPGGRVGPATLASQLVRKELEALDRGGPIQRLFNNPVVLATLFLLCVGLLVWGLWPPSAETLFQRGAALMASKDTDDWELAWQKYLNPLEEKHPDHAHQDEVEEFRQRLLEGRAKRQARKGGNGPARLPEGQWFLEKARRLRESGDEKGAGRLLKALIEAYRDVPDEAAWVARAEQELKNKPVASDGKRWESLREALERARALEKEGRRVEANAVRRALAELYRGNAEAEKMLKE